MREVVVIDDQPEVVELLQELLQRLQRQVRGFGEGATALEYLRSAPAVDLVVLDLDLGAGRPGGMELLPELRRLYPDIPVVILTGKGSVDSAVQAMRLGAADFIEKDPALGKRLGLQLEKAERLRRMLEENRRLQRRCAWLEERIEAESELVGRESGLRQVWERIQRLADIPRPVLICGERGTGKELVAAALHRLSNRRRGPFVTINCAALSESLAEAELFGHEKGAFTDAAEARPGKFEQADGGTLFLDEVGNMSPAIQKKILRVIEYQTFNRVRGSREIRVDVRICAATNADLQEEMRQGRFRSDFYDRLAFEVIQVPPLRERKQDIPQLCRHFLSRFRQEVAGVQCRDISAEALATLAARPFPGNVRELKNLVERAAYRCRSEVLGIEDLQEAAPPPAAENAKESLAEMVAAYEKSLLQGVLAECGSLADAARRLGLSYDQARRLARKHRLAAGAGKGNAREHRQ